MARRLVSTRLATGVVFLVLVITVMVGIRFGESGTEASRATSEFEPLAAPTLAVLLLEPPTVVLLNPETLTVEREIRLRSESIDIEARGDALVTAQCGGPGDASDSAVAVITPATGRVEYVETGFLDAEHVTPWGSAADSRWLVIHGEVSNGGSAGAIVDAASLRARDYSLSTGILCAENVNGQVWATGLTGDGSGENLAEELFIGNDAGWRLIEAVSDPVHAICEVDDGAVVVQSLDQGVARIAVRDSEGREIRDGRVGGFRAGVGRACSVKLGLLAIADSDWRDPGRGEQIILVDSESLEATGHVMGVPGPITLCAYEGALLVGCERTGEVLRIDTDTGKIVARVLLERSAVTMVDMTVWRGGV